MDSMEMFGLEVLSCNVIWENDEAGLGMALLLGRCGLAD